MDARGSERGTSEGRPRSWTARILAPVTLVAAAAAIVLVVSGTLGGSDDEGDAGEGGGKGGKRASVLTCDEPDAAGAVEAGYYVVESGEDLTAIADRTCMPLDRLIRLNRNLDPQAIPVGGCISLRRDACKALAEG